MGILRVSVPSQAGPLGTFGWREKPFTGQELHTKAFSSRKIRRQKQNSTSKGRGTSGRRDFNGRKQEMNRPLKDT